MKINDVKVVTEKGVTTTASSFQILILIFNVFITESQVLKRWDFSVGINNLGCFGLSFSKIKGV